MNKDRTKFRRNREIYWAKNQIKLQICRPGDEHEDSIASLEWWIVKMVQAKLTDAMEV